MSISPQGSGGGISSVEIETILDARNLDLTHMDRIDENVSAAKQIDITTANGTFTLPDGTTEQDVLEFLANDEQIEVTLDATLLAQITTVRVFNKTDGITYRLLQSSVYPADFDGNSITLILNGKGRDQKITLQSGSDEGETRAIPHARVEELRG